MKNESDMDDAWKQLENIMISGAPEVALKQMCPSCNSALRVAFTPGPRTALIIRCTSCYSAVTIDGGITQPQWVETFGANIVTGEHK